ncbi:alcohol dehydrogenase catalytic domain-containing protein [Conexibacter woesei]|uniref:Alcohol dehydrogenase GroES domain protein n=1 Tax=Conexibacter woesei (strain DSM 14684 / CCUG 47730 / CIP 108061 / JCM 11494 / NBRC 100937 / ID131577) TaxID=469383 RepID=D3EZY9_CONWI|nr:Zn-dependent alcohol dehydrogenase [Conexibacter woesei]ADB49965.1 Alcohol dehydrogenase GroES domain protein [Conexibacter woesei DSM 14684]
MSSFTSAAAPGAAQPHAAIRVFELHGPGSVRVGHRLVPPDGALMRVETTGVCGTDHHIWAGRIDVPVPLLLGHEVIGRLERLPDDHGLVADAPLSEGDRVLIAPGVPCGACAGCDGGGRCLDRPCYGLTMTGDGLTGGFSPYMTLLPGTRVFGVPEELPAERGVFAEPMACVLSALRKAFGAQYVPPGHDGLVLGFGVIGLCSATAIAAAGGTATVVEYDPARRELAASLGFEALASVEEAATAGARDGGFPLVVDAAGTPAAFASALDLLAWSGTLVELGNFADLGEVAIKPSDICLRDLRIVGSGETFYEDFPPAIALVGGTAVDLGRAITDVHRFDALGDPSDLFTVRAAGKAMVSFA